MTGKRDLADQEQVRAAVKRQVRARARWFLECALDNALAAYDGDGDAVAKIVADMIDHMRQ